MLQQSDKSVQDAARRKRQEYSEALKRQIEEQSKQKLSKDIAMSDYERRVNANYIKAYEDMNTGIDSMVVGIKPLRELESRRRSGGSSSLLENPYYGSPFKHLGNADRLAGVRESRADSRSISAFKYPSKLAEVAAYNIMDQQYQADRNAIRNSLDAVKYGQRHSLPPGINILNANKDYVPPSYTEIPEESRRGRGVRSVDVVKMKPAGVFARQRVDYNIISGINS